MKRSYRKVIALIGGTGLARGLEAALEDPRHHRDIEVRIGTETGRVLSCLEAFYDDLRILVLPRHGPTLEIPDRSPARLVAERGYESHIWFFHQQAVEAIYAFNAVGALDFSVPLASEGAFLVPDACARGIGATPHSFGSFAKAVHPSLQVPFDSTLRRHLIAAIEAAGGTAIDRGLYIYNGPDQFESAAEIRAVSRLFEGEPNRVVGMTAVPELVLSKQMEIPYALLCSASNYAQGMIPDEAISHSLVLDTMKVAAGRLVGIARELIRIVAADAANTPAVRQ
jgi:5'-methylthioinosine phosphorylase